MIHRDDENTVFIIKKDNTTHNSGSFCLLISVDPIFSFSLKHPLPCHGSRFITIISNDLEPYIIRKLVTSILPTRNNIYKSCEEMIYSKENLSLTYYESSQDQCYAIDMRFSHYSHIPVTKSDKIYCLSHGDAKLFI